MGFPNQVAADQFFNQLIKGLKVIAEVPNVNETGSVAGIALPATITVVGGILVSVATGLPVVISIALSPGVPIVPGAITIIPGLNGKVGNALTITVDVTAVVDGVTVTIALALPIVITGLIETGVELQPTDTIQKHDVQFRGGTVTPVTLAEVTTLTVTAVVELCLIVARETIFRINAAELFCR